MTEPFRWINDLLRANSLTAPNWEGTVSHDEVNQDEPFEIENWWCLDDDHTASKAYEHINKRYPERLVIPFARDKGSDDIACFVISDPASNASVVVIHDLTDPEIAVTGRYDTFEEWVESVREGGN